MAADRKAGVLRLVERFEQWAKDAEIKPEDEGLWDLSSDEEEEVEAALEGIEDPKERARVREERRQKKLQEKIEKRRRERAELKEKEIAAATPGSAAERRLKFQQDSMREADAMQMAKHPRQKRVDDATAVVALEAGAEEFKDQDEVPEEKEILSYWDEETQTYWYTDESTGINYYWDDESEEYKPEKDEDAVSESVAVPKNTPKLGVPVEPPKLASEEEFTPTDPNVLLAIANNWSIDLGILQRLEKGVRAFAFVKANGGMLKPLKLYFRAEKAKLYIVRNNRSQYLHIMHFGEINVSQQTLLELTMDESTGVSPLTGQPHIIFYTNEVYHLATKKKKHFRMPTALKKALKKQMDHRKSLLFVFEEFEDRDDLFTAINCCGKKTNMNVQMVR